MTKILDAKICTLCKEFKRMSDFHLGDRKSYSWCKRCRSLRAKKNYRMNSEVIKRKNKLYYMSLTKDQKTARKEKAKKTGWARAPEKNREYAIKHHGITVNDYAILLKKQNGVCALCHKEPGKRSLSIDHDHKCCPGAFSCGKCIRGLLCVTCNLLLGLMQDDIVIGKRCCEYLSRGEKNG